jgi:hypothetical protein
MKVKTKKIVQLGLHSVILATALSAGAATSISASDTPGVTTVSNSDCAVVNTASPFAFTPSRAVGLAWACDAATVAVNSGNTRGKFSYGGSSNGGSVKQCGSSVSTSNGFALTPNVTGDGCS